MEIYTKPTKIFNVVKTEVVDGSENVTEKSIVATFLTKESADAFVKQLEDGVNDWVSYSVEWFYLSNGSVKVTDIVWKENNGDVPDEDDVPSEVLIPNGELKQFDKLWEAVEEWLYDNYGYHTENFTFKEI